MPAGVFCTLLYPQNLNWHLPHKQAFTNYLRKHCKKPSFLPLQLYCAQLALALVSSGLKSPPGTDSISGLLLPPPHSQSATAFPSSAQGCPRSEKPGYRGFGVSLPNWASGSDCWAPAYSFRLCAGHLRTMVPQRLEKLQERKLMFKG